MEENEKQKKIEELKKEIKELKEEGSFKQVYAELRRATVEVNKMDTTEEEKKKQLIEVCENSIESIRNSL